MLPPNVETNDSLLFISEPIITGEPLTAEAALAYRVNKLEKINGALMRRVERSLDRHTNAYSLFQAAIILEEEVRARTLELRSVLRDLERSNLELSIAKASAERANQTKTRFLAAASHDLLQPVNAALLSMTGLEDEPVGEHAEVFVKQIGRSLTTIGELLRTLLDISKLDAGVTQPEVRSILIAPIIHSIESDFKAVAERKRLDLRVTNSPVCVESDPIFLRRILQNLVSNALNYTPAGFVSVSCRIMGNELVIEIEDSGVGIPEEHQEHIFDEFYRGESVTDRHADGLGLGLAIVKRMATALGHSITFSSRVGHGTTFTVRVPVSMSLTHHDIASHNTFDYALAHEGAFVVLIENDVNVLAAMKQLLAKWSCNIVSGATMSQIQTALEDVERTPDLMIADYHLNNRETGLDCIDFVRKRFGVHFPGLVITADYNAEVARLVEASKCDLLTKPVQPAELRALMTHLLRRPVKKTGVERAIPGKVD